LLQPHDLDERRLWRHHTAPSHCALACRPGGHDGPAHPRASDGAPRIPRAVSPAARRRLSFDRLTTVHLLGSRDALSWPITCASVVTSISERSRTRESARGRLRALDRARVRVPASGPRTEGAGAGPEPPTCGSLLDLHVDPGAAETDSDALGGRDQLDRHPVLVPHRSHSASPAR